MDRKAWDPAQIFREYDSGRAYKAGLGHRGLYEQSKINERFYVGDQWYGAQCGDDRPLVRHNVIKRIGDYKMALVGANPIAVSYTAEGIPSTTALQNQAGEEMAALSRGEAALDTLSEEERVNVLMAALSDYFRVTAERVGLDDIKEQALRNAYISGTGVVYTYWDDSIRTGLYADQARRVPIMGDIACEVLDIENLYFGDPTLDDLQAQPYILAVQRRSVEELRREARRNRRSEEEIAAIVPDRDTASMAGDRAEAEPSDSAKATVITKFWKEWDKDGSCRIKAAVVVKGAVIRGEWDTRLRLYPFALFPWERRRSCSYGESEITYLIPNQIAINRMLTASVWAVMMLGMPLTLVNKSMIPYAHITNEPGQIIEVESIGTGESIGNALGYVNPPSFSPAFDNNIASLIANTLTQSGANDAALGDVRPDNTSAIIALREAATLPMQTVQNRFYSFMEDVARIWAEFWVNLYGARELKIEDKNGVWYLPFDGESCRDLLISVRVDVGAASLWSELQSVSTLDNLFSRQMITPLQYLERLPKGTVPDLNGLIRELREAAEANVNGNSGMTEMMRASEAAAEAGAGVPGGINGEGGQGGQGAAEMAAAALRAGGVGTEAQAVVAGLPPEYQAIFAALAPEEQAAMLEEIGVKAG